MKRFLFFLAVCSFWSCNSQNQLPNGFDYVRNTIPDVKLELRYFGEDNFIGSFIEGYHKDVAIMSVEAINALKKVQDELKQYNLSIKIFDGYRPQQAVNHFVRWAKKLDDTINKKKFYPKIKKEHLFEEGYISAKSGHSRGSTLDMTLVDIETRAELDMGSPWDFFGPESWVANLELTSQQRANRMLLQTIMRKHGFKYYTKEWWHFTLDNEPFPDTFFNFPVN